MANAEFVQRVHSLIIIEILLYILKNYQFTLRRLQEIAGLAFETLRVVSAIQTIFKGRAAQRAGVGICQVISQIARSAALFICANFAVPQTGSAFVIQ